MEHTIGTNQISSSDGEPPVEQVERPADHQEEQQCVEIEQKFLISLPVKPGSKRRVTQYKQNINASIYMKPLRNMDPLGQERLKIFQRGHKFLQRPKDISYLNSLFIQVTIQVNTVQINSLYPFINKTYKCPTGHARMHVGSEECKKLDLNKVESLIKCTVLDPRKLRFPVVQQLTK